MKKSKTVPKKRRAGPGRPQIELNELEMERAGRMQPTMGLLAAFFGISRPTLRAAFKRDPKLGEALARGKSVRTAAFMRRQQQLADGYWYCAVQVDEKGRVICRNPLESLNDECPAHPGEYEPGSQDVKRAFCPPHVIASIWVGKNQEGQADRSPILERDMKKMDEDELDALTLEALEFSGAEVPEETDDEPEEEDEPAVRSPRRGRAPRGDEDDDERRDDEG